MSGWLLALLAVLCATLGLLLHRTRAELRRLRARFTGSLAQLERLERTFIRFAPHQLVEKVIASDEAMTGETREVTVLFADLVGFTQLSEQLDAAVLVDVLNGYFDHMTRAINEHRGQVSTFLGDGLLALFGALETDPWQSDSALHAALAMRRELSSYNRELARRGLPPLGLGIGVHRGTGIAGLIGSREKMEFAVVGGVVNIAARLQSHTRVTGVDILASRFVCEAADPRFMLRALPAAELRGINQPIPIFAVERFADAESIPGSTEG